MLIGPGTGVAPFRGFWHSLHHKYKTEGVAIPKLWLFFGCRQRALDLYREEKNLMLEEKIIDREFLALSRQPGLKKVIKHVLRLTKFIYIYTCYLSLDLRARLSIISGR